MQLRGRCEVTLCPFYTSAFIFFSFPCLSCTHLICRFLCRKDSENTIKKMFWSVRNIITSCCIFHLCTLRCCRSATIGPIKFQKYSWIRERCLGNKFCLTFTTLKFWKFEENRKIISDMFVGICILRKIEMFLCCMHKQLK